MARYNNPAMAQLSRQQVRYAPRSVRLKQIERAERFVDRLHPERFYAYQDVCEELTGYRSEKYPDLQLSGHTHGGQFPPWKYVVSLHQPYAAGLHRRGNTWIYVNRGAGYWGPPIRLGAPSEVTLLTLVRS